MKKKTIVVAVLAVASAGLLVVQGVSQPSGISESGPLRSPPLASSPPAFNRVEPRIDTQECLNFEQLAEALKGVRARQKELKAQETDILAKMADKIEEKRKDLQKAEEVLRQAQERPSKSDKIPERGSIAP